MNHSQGCKLGGWIVARHNDVREFLIRWISVCAHPVREPPLHPLQGGDNFQYRTANIDPDARSDVKVEGLLDPHRPTFIDVAIFNRHELTYAQKDLPSIFHDLERRKERAYSERIATIEHGHFTPFICSSLGALGPAAHNIMRVLARHVADKTRQSYSNVVLLMRADLSFTITKAALACLRGPRAPCPKADFWAMTPAYLRAMARLDSTNH